MSDDSSRKIKTATERWFENFSAFPASMIELLMNDYPGDWEELGCDGLFLNEEYPVCAYYYQFGNALDDDWLENENNIATMIDCGLRVFKHKEWGIFFCVDGLGYDLFEKHWIPLYIKRTLEWRDSDEIKPPKF